MKPDSHTLPPSLLQGLSLPKTVFDDQMVYIQVARQGIPGKVIKQAVVKLGHRDLFVTLLGTTASNLSRFYTRKALDQAQSENVLNALGLFSKAYQVFGDVEKADDWLNSHVVALGNETPISLCDTFKGRGMVEQALRKIEYGDFS